ncbi:MAG TPA: glycosyltransferase [Terriglobales bacterium]|nr:glycosyltransferase [Terriglobales bacterium]
MRLAIFGLTISSSWGNGHATIWRGLCAALARRGHEVTFFERDVSYYANHRDLADPPGYRIVFYSDWDQVEPQARAVLNRVDAAMITSYCPDAVAAAELILASKVPVRVYYDLDTPVTLERLREQGTVEYVPSYGLEPFDLVLSYTGGRALRELQQRLGARKVAPLYGSVDPDTHRPVQPNARYGSDLSYLGTYAADRQPTLNRLFIEPARRLPEKRFLIGGAQYPDDFPWTENIWFVSHVPPAQHPAFYCSSKLTLSVTRAAMAEMGYCPSGRLFEAAACETPLVSDWWDGLDEFFEPGREILVASTASEVLSALTQEPEQLRRVGTAARQRVMAEHTADHRCQELIRLLEVNA